MVYGEVVAATHWYWHTRATNSHKTELNKRDSEATANPQVSSMEHPFTKEREVTKIPGICVSYNDV